VSRAAPNSRPPLPLPPDRRRIDPARVRRPYRSLARGTLASNSAGVCTLLQRNQNAPVIEQRCAGLSPGSADWKYQIAPNPRRTSSLTCGFRFQVHTGAFPDRYETILRKLWLNRGKIHRLGQRSGLSLVIYELVLAIAPEINYSVGCI
jgi:hypothetical protein